MTSENVQAAQLIAEGPQDIWLTGDPQTSFFRSMYRRHVSYGMSTEKFNFNGDTVRFDRRGDLLGSCYLTASDPVTNIQLSTFPISGLARVDLFIGGQLVDSQDTTFSSQVWPVTEATTWSERMVPQSFYPLRFFFCKDWSRAFPLVALEYHDLEIKIRDASSSYTFTLWAHMIHLSEQERAWYKRQPHRFLITQVQTARIDLQRDWGRFGGPIKYLAWPAQNFIPPIPDAITGFTAINPTSSTVDLVWNPVLYATLYSIIATPVTTAIDVPGYTYVPFSFIPSGFTLTSSSGSWYNNNGVIFDGPDYGGNIINISSTQPFDIYSDTNSGTWYTLTDGSNGYVRHAGFDMYLTDEYSSYNFDFAWALYLKNGTTDQVIIYNPYPVDNIGYWVSSLDGHIRINTQNPYEAQIFTISIPLLLNTQTTFNPPLTFTDLVPDTEYTFTITPSNVTGNGPSTTSDPISTLPNPVPNAVTGFTVSNPTTTTVDMVWDPALYATSYSIIETSTPEIIQTTSGTTFTFTDLVPDTEYTFTITPSNVTGNGPSTTSDPISTLPSVPDAVTGFTASNRTTTTIELIWDPALYATSYSIIETSTPEIIQTTSDTTFTFTDLVPDTEYTFTITPSNVTGNGPSTTSDPISTLPPVPNAVTGFTASNPTTTTIDLAWDSALYATSYSISETSTPEFIETTSDTTFMFTNLVPDTEYTFTITPSNVTGNGPSTTSDPISTLLPLPGFGPAMYSDPTNVTETTMDLAWLEYVPEYATSFNVYAYSVLDGLIGFVNVPISSFSYTYTGLEPGTEYYFAVAGVNATGVGPEGSGTNTTYTVPWV
jgi:hypothetical protein